MHLRARSELVKVEPAEAGLAEAGLLRVGLLSVVLASVASMACLTLAARMTAVGHLATSAVLHLVLSALMAAAALSAATMVGVRRPGSVVATLLAAQGLVPCVVAVSDTYDAVTSAHPGLLPVDGWLVALDQSDWMLWYLPPALLLLLFPDGHLPGRRWRPAAIALLVVPVVFCVALAAGDPFPAPFRGVAPPVPTSGLARVVMEVLGIACPLALFVCLTASFAGMVVRYRRSAGVARAQMRWFLLGAGALPGTLLLCWASYLLLAGPDLVVVGLVVLGIAVPAATAVAIVRHDLYDVDKALAAATTYALLSAGVLVVYTLASFVGGLAMGQRSPVIAAAATAVCAAALAPTHRRVRAAVDSRVHPVRQRALAAVAQLRERTHAGQAHPEQLAEALAEALGDPQVRVGYRVPGTVMDVDAGGQALPGPGLGEHEAAVVLAGEPIGVLVAGPACSRPLLREVASACALLVEVVRLRVGLSGALRQVEDSRTRLLTASYAERRLLERDLHDGAQQRLVSLGMALRLAQRGVREGTTPAAQVDDVLDGAVDQLAQAVVELRRLAHGLRPSSLDDGLGSALSRLVEHVPVPVTLDVTVGEVAESVATTAYYVASEAVTNAVKHAAADRIAVRVTVSGPAGDGQAGGDLTVQVSDDGLGGASVRPGTGLAGLLDRVAAAGGQLQVRSAAGRGTVVEAVLPCVS